MRAEKPEATTTAPAQKAPKDRQFVTALARGLQSLSCFSAPVFGYDGSVVYTLNCGGPRCTLTAAVLRKEVAPKLLALARMFENVIES